MAGSKGNKNAVGNDGGRPPAFKTPAQLEKKCDAYFEYIKGESKEEKIPGAKKSDKAQTITVWIRYPEPATITGLTLFLGFCDRQSLYDYQARVEFSAIIKKARTKVESQYEKNLSGTTPTGSIFALKNMGWKDKVETGFTDGKGDDIAPVQILLPHNKRT